MLDYQSWRRYFITFLDVLAQKNGGQNFTKKLGLLDPLSSYLRIIPSKLEVAPNALKMLDGVGEWMDG